MEYLLFALFTVVWWVSYATAWVQQWYHCWGWGHEPVKILSTENNEVICLGCKTCGKTFWVEEHINRED